jgi:polar amino acid transport system substrate-binding protein
MKTTSSTLIAVILSVLASYVTVKMTAPQMRGGAPEAKKETAYERVMRTKTLRCGYIIWPPEFNKNPNTGDFSGISYDIITEAAKRIGLKIDWVEEVNFTTMGAALEANRFDAICFSLYRDAPRALFSRMTIPLFYSGTGVFVRSDDSRFNDTSVKALDNSDYTVAVMDGEMSAITAAKKFPKAKQVSIPNTANATDLLMNVAGGKADFTLMNMLVGAKFADANPNTVKNITPTQPVQLFSHGFAFQKDAEELVTLVNVALQEMHDQGVIEDLLLQHTEGAGSYLRVAKPYQ